MFATGLPDPMFGRWPSRGYNGRRESRMSPPMVKVLPKDCQFGEAVIIALIRKKVSPSGHGGWGRYARPVDTGGYFGRMR